MAVLGKSKIEKLLVGTGQPSTSPTTGAEIVDGGLGVSGDVNVGGNLNANNVEQTLTNDGTKIPSSKAVFEGTLKTATASAEKVASTSPAEVEVTTQDRNSNFHFKIPSGNDGKSLQLLANTLFFRADQDGVINSDQTITLTVQASNLQEQVTWNDETIAAGTLQYQISAEEGTTFEDKTFTVSADGLSSSITISTLREGDSPTSILLENDYYTFSISGGESSVLEGILPRAISGFCVMRGNEEQPFVIGSSTEGWGVTAVFAAVMDNSSTTDASLFDGEIQTNGVIVVTTLSPTIQQGEILITATNSTLGQAVSATLTVLLKKMPGFGTPQVSTETLPQGQDASVSVSLDSSSPETAKKFIFEFGLPRGADPIYISMNPDCVAIPASESGYVDPGINLPGASSVKIYEGTDDVTTLGWTFTALDSSTDSVVFNITQDGVINVAGWGGTADSYVKTIQVTRASDGVTLTKGLMFYKAKAGSGQKGDTGDPAGFGTVTAVVTADESAVPRVEVQSSGPNTAKNFVFTFYNIGGSGSVVSADEDTAGISKLYNSVNQKTDGGVTPAAVYNVFHSMGIEKVVHRYQFTAATTSYTIPNYSQNQEIDVFYNGIIQVPETDYTLTSTGTINFTKTLGGSSVTQTLVVVARTLTV